MATIKAFIRGVLEFRSGFTTQFECDDMSRAYDRGREFAHRITFRRFED